MIQLCPAPSQREGTPAANRRRRVCVVGSGWQFYSGISLYTCCLANAFADTCQTSSVLMRRLLPRFLYPGAARVGMEVSTAAYRDDVTVFDGVDYWALPSLLRAVAFLRKTRPEVLVMQWWTGVVLHSYLALALCARLVGARIVLELHEIQDTGEARHRFARWYTRMLLRPLLALVGSVVVHSDFDRDIVARHPDFRGLPIDVIRHGPYDHLPAPVASPSTQRCSTTQGEGEYCYLYFGTIRPYKGVEYLVEAFNGLDAEEVANRRLVVVGETWEGWDLPAKLIEASPYRDRITFVNRYVHDTEAAEFFAQADAVVLPYLRSSASGPLHLAMSRGLPIAVSAVGGLVEAAQDYQGTVFFPAGDVVDLRAALQLLPMRSPQVYVDPHEWSRNVAAFDRVFDALFQPAGRVSNARRSPPESRPTDDAMHAPLVRKS